jgi:hypothetical protein
MIQFILEYGAMISLLCIAFINAMMFKEMNESRKTLNELLVFNTYLRDLILRINDDRKECKFYKQEMPTVKEIHKVVPTSSEFMSDQYKRVAKKYNNDKKT